jgi:hypothetical protein
VTLPVGVQEPHAGLVGCFANGSQQACTHCPHLLTGLPWLPACITLSWPAWPAVRLLEYRFSNHERGWVQKHLLEAFEFEGAAVEFGGDCRCRSLASTSDGGSVATA